MGHGGIPEVRERKVREAQGQEIPGTPYAWKNLTTTVGGVDVRASVIDGPNTLISPDPDFAPQGLVEIRLDGPSIEEHWYVADGAVEVPLP